MTWVISDVEMDVPDVPAGEKLIVAVWEPQRDPPMRVEYRETVRPQDADATWANGFALRAQAHRQAQHARFQTWLTRVAALEGIMNSVDP